MELAVKVEIKVILFIRVMHDSNFLFVSFRFRSFSFGFVSVHFISFGFISFHVISPTKHAQKGGGGGYVYVNTERSAETVYM